MDAAIVTLLLKGRTVPKMPVDPRRGGQPQVPPGVALLCRGVRGVENELETLGSPFTCLVGCRV